jgi:hypothetical protein
MIFIDIDFAISKTDTIFFNFDIAYVFHLAHACCVVLKEHDSLTNFIARIEAILVLIRLQQNCD